MKFNRHVTSFLAASAIAFALPVQAHQRGSSDTQGAPGARMFRHLDLTAAQREQVSKIFQEQAPAFRSSREADRAAHSALRKAAIDPNVDSGRVRQLADAAGKAHADAAVLRAETLRRVVPLLTPEQRAKLEKAPGHSGSRGQR